MSIAQQRPLPTGRPDGGTRDAPGGRARVTVPGRRTDILDQERAHGRISAAAYRTGEIVQAVFERLGYAGIGSASLDGGGSRDAVEAIGARLVQMLESAEACRGLMDRMTRQIGIMDTRLLRRVLGDRMSFSDCAAFQGKNGERGAAYVAARFRDALEDLAMAWTAQAPARIVATREDRPDAVVTEPGGARADRPIVAGCSAVTSELGRAALAAYVGAGGVPDAATAVKRLMDPAEQR